MAQVEGIVENTLVKKSLDRNIGTITLDSPSKHNALGAGLIRELLINQVVPAERLESATTEMAGYMIRNSPLVISLFERAVACARRSASVKP